MVWPSWTLIWSGLFIGYICHSVWTIYQIFIPPVCSDGGYCIPSYLGVKPRLQIVGFISDKHSSVPQLATPLWHENIIQYEEPVEWSKLVPIPDQVYNNGSLFMHVFLVPKQPNTMKYRDLGGNMYASYARVKLTLMHTPTAATFNLLGSSQAKNVTGKGSDGAKIGEGKADDKSKAGNEGKNGSKQTKHQKVNHVRKKVTFNVMADKIGLPERQLPPEIGSLLVLNPEGQYLPLLQYNFLSTRLSDLEEVKSTTKSVNVTLTFSPSSFGKIRFLLNLEASFRALLSFGFSEKDLDDLKGLLEGANLYLLCCTVLISSVHLLLDFLALKNDVSFWKVRSNLTGLSPRAVFWRAFSQAVIFFYLLEEKTSLLVIVPSGIGTLIEFWKVQKIIEVKVETSHWGIPYPIFNVRGSSQEEQLTRALDAEAMQYLCYLLYPLCLGGAVYSLLYEPHRSWYSWGINSLVNGVYAFGFLFMLPQLFINYRLKSVAHLPWRVFMYKAFNTFIDDVFAFIITMPTAHRVACFRDDAVFFVYLFQRWLYPVDKTRREEGTSTAGPETSEISSVQEGKKNQ